MPSEVDASSAQLDSEKKLSVLIIEDDFEYSTLLTDALQARGCDVVFAPNHDVACEKMAAEKIDVIFSDAMTKVWTGAPPVGVDGVRSQGEAFFKGGHHKKEGKALPVVTISGIGTKDRNPDMEERAKQHGSEVFRASKQKLFHIEGEGMLVSPTGVKEEALDEVLEWAKAQIQKTGDVPSRP